MYQDVSTGKIVAEHKTKVREANCLKQNPYSGIICAGNRQGVVSMWSPNTGVALASLFCHQGAVLDIGLTRDGNY